MKMFNHFINIYRWNILPDVVLRFWLLVVPINILALTKIMKLAYIQVLYVMH